MTHNVPPANGSRLFKMLSRALSSLLTTAILSVVFSASVASATEIGQGKEQAFKAPLESWVALANPSLMGEPDDLSCTAIAVAAATVFYAVVTSPPQRAHLSNSAARPHARAPPYGL